MGHPVRVFPGQMSPRLQMIRATGYPYSTFKSSKHFKKSMSLSLFYLRTSLASVTLSTWGRFAGSFPCSGRSDSSPM